VVWWKSADGEVLNGRDVGETSGDDGGGGGGWRCGNVGVTMDVRGKTMDGVRGRTVDLVVDARAARLRAATTDVFICKKACAGRKKRRGAEASREEGNVMRNRSCQEEGMGKQSYKNE
jgi:hypothetical protein